MYLEQHLKEIDIEVFPLLKVMFATTVSECVIHVKTLDTENLNQLSFNKELHYSNNQVVLM